MDTNKIPVIFYGTPLCRVIDIFVDNNTDDSNFKLKNPVAYIFCFLRNSL